MAGISGSKIIPVLLVLQAVLLDCPCAVTCLPVPGGEFGVVTFSGVVGERGDMERRGAWGALIFQKGMECSRQLENIQVVWSFCPSSVPSSGSFCLGIRERLCRPGKKRDRNVARENM